MGKEITIYDIARELRVSTATISRALSGSKFVNQVTVRRVLEKAQEMGYRYNNFAGNLGGQKSYTIGIILPRLNSNFISSILSGIEKIATEARYDILITHSNENYETEKANTINLYHKRVDGIIASLALPTKNLDHFKPFFQKKIPVIFFDRVDDNCDQPQVVIDNYKSGYMATKHLIEQGCQRIGILTSDLNRNVYDQRHRGYTDAILDAGLTYDQNLLLVKDISEKSALEAAKEILAMDPMPDGLFITNDFEAVVCMQSLKLYGVRIPEDIAIVGFNNDTICKIVDPPLTTINYPGKEIGEISARELIDQLKGLKTITGNNRIIVKSELIVRKSSLKNKKY